MRGDSLVEYLITFLEGIITFISPCLLPMLPIYISYFAVQNDSNNRYAALGNAVGFVLGFTLVFTTMGAFAGTIGGFLQEYSKVVNLIAGGIVLLFGLNFMEIINIPLLNTTRQVETKTLNLGFFTAMLFGIVFSISWTPCVGAFLGSALMLAASSGESLKGILMLLCFSLGLGIPFIASAILIDNLMSVFAFIKRNYRTINMISGSLLVVVGIMMMTGWWGSWLAALTF
jgi:cytochrome c-type biogenesis protein